MSTTEDAAAMVREIGSLAPTVREATEAMQLFSQGFMRLCDAIRAGRHESAAILRPGARQLRKLRPHAQRSRLPRHKRQAYRRRAGRRAEAAAWERPFL